MYAECAQLQLTFLGLEPCFNLNVKGYKTVIGKLKDLGTETYQSRPSL